jgi:hypothetical protein
MAVVYLTYEELKDFEDLSKINMDTMAAMVNHPDWR